MKFSQYVKENYSSVKHLPNKERMKKLASDYRAKMGTSEPKAKTKRMHKEKGGDFVTDFVGDKIGDVANQTLGMLKSAIKADLDQSGGELKMKKAKRTRKAKDETGGGLLTDAFGQVGLNPLAFIGLGLHMDKKPHSQVVKEPMNLMPPSVGVDRAYNRSTAVPGPLKFTQKETFNPEVQQMLLRQQGEPRVMKQGPGMVLQQNVPEIDPTGGGILSGLLSTIMPKEEKHESKTETGGSLSLKSILKKHDLPMPKGMRDRKPGSKLTKKDLAKIYDSAVAKHGAEKGGNFFSDMFDGLKTGFMLPFKAIHAIV